MTIFERVGKYLKRVWGGFWKHNGEALEAWAEQFASDLGNIVLAAAANYGAQVYTGTMTMSQAKDAVLADLKKKGIEESKELAEIVFNAIRTQVNAAKVK